MSAIACWPIWPTLSLPVTALAGGPFLIFSVAPATHVCDCLLANMANAFTACYCLGRWPLFNIFGSSSYSCLRLPVGQHGQRVLPQSAVFLPCYLPSHYRCLPRHYLPCRYLPCLVICCVIYRVISAVPLLFLLCSYRYLP